MDDRARTIEVLALDAHRLEEFARKSKSIVGARDTGRPALVAELARVAFAVAESPGHRRLGHLCLLGADPPAHGCRAIPACARRAAGREGKSSIVPRAAHRLPLADTHRQGEACPLECARRHDVLVVDPRT